MSKERYGIRRFALLNTAGYSLGLFPLEEPLSGMSMNPARTFGPALFGQIWDALWIYFTAPPLGMRLAAELYIRARGRHAVWCAKLHHDNDKRCIFRCARPAV